MKTSLYLLALIMLLAAPAHAEVTYTLDEDYGKVPVTFTLNEGQFESSIKFSIEGNGQGMFTESSLASGTTFVLDATFVSPGETYSGFFLHFVEANGNPAITGEDRVSWNSNYFIGNDPENWHTDIPNYRSIRLHDLYEGIDLVYTSDARRLVFNLVVHPGHAPTQVGFIHPHELGDATITETGDGGLIVEHKGYPAKTYYPPRCYQMIGGQEVDVEISYRFSGLFVYFEFGEYDEAQDLIIELNRVYSTKFAYKETKEVNDLEIDDDGNAYVAGDAGYIVLDGDHPGPGGSGGFGTLFALKLNETGDELRYVTCFGSDTAIHYIGGIAVDSMFNLFVAGYFNGNFPVTNDAVDKEKYSDPECFVIQFSQQGNDILHATYFGGSKYEDLTAFCIDEKGNVLLAGTTTSSDFQVTNNAYDNSFTAHIWEGFVTLINSSLTEIVFSTFIDGAQIGDIDVDLSGNIYLTGENTGTLEFPTTDGVYDPEYNGGNDAIIVKFSPDGSSLLYSTYIGGSDKDLGRAIDVDERGRAVITGYTYSTDFPIKSSTLSDTYNGSGDSFILKMNEDGSDIVYSGYLGGSKSDSGYDVCIDNDNTSYVVGTTESGDFPLFGNPITNKNMQYVPSITIINEDGTSFLLSTYFYGSGIRKVARFNSKILLMGDASTNNIPAILLDGSEDNFFVSSVLIEISNAIAQEKNVRDSDLTSTCFPNPFNSNISISFFLPYNSKVTVDIYNVTGQKVDAICSENLLTGCHQLTWNGDNVSSGLYFIRLHAENNTIVNKVLLLK